MKTYFWTCKNLNNFKYDKGKENHTQIQYKKTVEPQIENFERARDQQLISYNWSFIKGCSNPLLVPLFSSETMEARSSGITYSKYWWKKSIVNQEFYIQ